MFAGIFILGWGLCRVVREFGLILCRGKEVFSEKLNKVKRRIRVGFYRSSCVEVWREEFLLLVF